MSQTFAQVVEEVKQLSLREKGVLRDLLKRYIIEETRREIRESCEAGMKEFPEGKLTSFSDIDKLMVSLSHD